MSTKLGKKYEELGQFSITEHDAGLIDCEQVPDVVTSPTIMTSTLRNGTNVYGRYICSHLISVNIEMMGN